MAKFLEEKAKFEKWSRSHFRGNIFEIMTTNITETVNNMMRKAREYPITALIDCVLFKMGQWFLTRRWKALALESPITLNREEILRNRWDQAGSLKSIPVE